MKREYKTYGKIKDTWWLLLDKYDDVMKYLPVRYHSENFKKYVTKILSFDSGVIAINGNGGYHGGLLSDYTNINDYKDYPTCSIVYFSWSGIVNNTYPYS